MDKNILWWQEFRAAMQEVNSDVFLVGEVWDATSISGPFLNKGLDSVFNFDLSTNIQNAARGESSNGIVGPLIRARQYYAKINPDFIDSTFITNHDMDRVMSKVGGNTNRARMAAALLFTLPGSPFMYYGEEIGMKGAKPDEYIREPLLWGDNETAGTTSNWIATRYNQDTISIAEQTGKTFSLLEHYRSMIRLRRSTNILIKGDLVESQLKVDGIVSFVRSFENQSLLVLHNMTKEEKIITLTDEEAAYQFVYYSNALPNVKLKKSKGTVTFTLSAYSTVVLSK
jgi:glycosidase